MKSVSSITDKLSLCLRGKIYYARIRLDTGRYAWQSLGIAESPKSNRKKAEQAALIYAGSVQNKQQNSQPIVRRTFGNVIAEYVKLRTAENAQKRTTDSMLRVIIRVTKCLNEYAGAKSVAAIGNKELEEYVIWRTDYYQNRPMPKNAKQAPKDKTIQWEITLFKTILRWAHGRGYLGAKSLPTWSFKVKSRTVRPAFTWAEYNKLWRAMDKWQKNCVHSDRQYTRQLLRDYVLILANSGMRVGEANNLRLKDLKSTRDIKKRKVLASPRTVIHIQCS